MPNDFITVAYLATFAGMVAAVALVVQFTKGLVKRSYGDQAVRLYAFLWALALVAVVSWYSGSFSGGAQEVVMQVMLCLLNACLVALAAMGGYETVADPYAEKELPENYFT